MLHAIESRWFIIRVTSNYYYGRISSTGCDAIDSAVPQH